MEKLDESLKALLEQGREKGYLTYSQVNDHLPDDDANPEKIDQLLTLLEGAGIELTDEADVEELVAGGLGMRRLDPRDFYIFEGWWLGQGSYSIIVANPDPAK